MAVRKRLTAGLGALRARYAGSVSGDYFEGLFADKDDPWDYETSDYEHRKYGAVLDSMPRERYRSALEVACANGVFTELLAARCDNLLAIDISRRAVELTGRRCAGKPHVRTDVVQVPKQFPVGSFDYVNVGEVGYYWSAVDLKRSVERIVGAMENGGHLQLVHTFKYKPDRQVDGETVHDAFRTAPGLRSVLSVRSEDGYLLDVLEKR
ncbi:MAG: SAM-dependent methyltransferase [Acidimicrobiia bacterium]